MILRVKILEFWVEEFKIKGVNESQILLSDRNPDVSRLLITVSQKQQGFITLYSLGDAVVAKLRMSNKKFLGACSIHS